MSATGGRRSDSQSRNWRRTAAALFAVTLLGAGAGASLGYAVLGPMSAGSAPNAAPAVAPAEKNSQPGDAGGKPPANQGADVGAELEVKELPPIVTNLAWPEKSWVRLQAAIVYDPKELQRVELVAAALMSDITAFLGTLELSNIEGPDGLRWLQEELRERAAIRSKRQLKDLLIETLVVQ